jgi:hypothetical protein
MLVKWPTVVLILTIAAGVLLAIRKVRLPANFLVIASFPIVFLVFAIFSKIDIGDRHILPLYPFALLLCALSWEWAGARRGVLLALALAVAVHAGDSLRYAPAYISYFNLFVKQDQGYKLLSDSNVDWGQGLLAVKKYEDEHPGAAIHLAYWGSMDPRLYGIRADSLSAGDHPSGVLIVSATTLTGQFLPDYDTYTWLQALQPTGVLDHALLVYDSERSSKSPAKRYPLE